MYLQGTVGHGAITAADLATGISRLRKHTPSKTTPSSEPSSKAADKIAPPNFPQSAERSNFTKTNANGDHSSPDREPTGTANGNRETKGGDGLF